MQAGSFLVPPMMTAVDGGRDDGPHGPIIAGQVPCTGSPSDENEAAETHERRLLANKIADGSPDPLTRSIGDLIYAPLVDEICSKKPQAQQSSLVDARGSYPA